MKNGGNPIILLLYYYFLFFINLQIQSSNQEQWRMGATQLVYYFIILFFILFINLQIESSNLEQWRMGGTQCDRDERILVLRLPRRIRHQVNSVTNFFIAQKCSKNILHA
jgi:hypothetical protein